MTDFLERNRINEEEDQSKDHDPQIDLSHKDEVSSAAPPSNRAKRSDLCDAIPLQKRSGLSTAAPLQELAELHGLTA
jgi:hypothetical protein